VRQVLTANRTYYVRTDGSDSNDGLANTSGGAFQTLQKAMDVIGALDCSIYNVAVNVGAGTYTAGLVLKSVIGSGYVNFIGNTTTPSSVFIDVASGPAVNSNSAVGTFYVQGFKLRSGNSQDIALVSRCYLFLTSNEYAGTANYRVRVSNQSFAVFGGANNFVSGGGIGFCLVERSSIATMFSCTFTATTNITYSTAFMTVRGVSYLEVSGNTFALGAFTVTGSAYSVLLNGVISGTGGNTSYFPGSSAGTAASGGQV
jgi:hypothetical protein